MKNLQVKNLMMGNPVFIDPDDTLEDAAVEMKEAGCGVLPVGGRNGVLGMITDRDIVVRALSHGKDPANEKVRHCMTPKVYSCSETDTVAQAVDLMREHAVSRLIVKNDVGRVSEILSFGTILRSEMIGNETADFMDALANRPVHRKVA